MVKGQSIGQKKIFHTLYCSQEQEEQLQLFLMLLKKDKQFLNTIPPEEFKIVKANGYLSRGIKYITGIYLKMNSAKIAEIKAELNQESLGEKTL